MTPYLQDADFTLTRAQAEAAGYAGYAQHLSNVRCPHEEDPRIYCATCQGALAQLSKEQWKEVRYQ